MSGDPVVETKEKSNPSIETENFIQQPWALSIDRILRELSTNPSTGLQSQEVNERLQQYGSNELRKHVPKSVLRIFIDQFKSLIIALLGAAAIIAFIYGEFIEGVSILAVIFINALIGFFTEFRAIRSMEALYALTRVSARVRRDGQVKEIPATEIVPGDVLVIEGGDVIPADVRLTESNKLQVDESTLTGESVPVGKRTDPLDENTPLAERKNMLFKGTSVTRGSGVGIVTGTGMQTELGQISSLVQETTEEITPLEQRLDKLGHKLIGVTLIITVFVSISGIIAGKEIFLMIETGIALAVATIPEGLPIVATIALARGMQQMARKNALINRLSSVETLGATNVICTDKTGTLTENRMTARKYLFESGEVTMEKTNGEGEFYGDGERIDPLKMPVLKEALEVGMLCNNATFDGENGEEQSGDPLEVALIEAGTLAKINHKELKENYPESREEAFDPETKMMATFHPINNHYKVAIKGAPETILNRCTRLFTNESTAAFEQKDRERWLQKNEQLAQQGFRVLGLAVRKCDDDSVDPYEDMTFLGLVGLADPPRQEVKAAIEQCKKAGIKIVMVTGDQPATALSIAKSINLIHDSEEDVINGEKLEAIADLPEDAKKQLTETSVFARVSPKQKLNLIDLHQKAGNIVAMTGDGVNDAPALKKADIGIAMGRRGTQVAREAADMVLQDDSLSTIVTAVEQGRVIFGNIRSFVYYLLSCNISEVLVVGLASMAGAPLPILPLQILFLNLVTDIFPALALGVGHGEKEILKRPPRDPKESILERRHWMGITVYGLFITASVLTALYVSFEILKMPRIQAVTISFLTLAMSQLWHVFNMRSWRSSVIINEITKNNYVWGALFLCVLLIISSIYIPGFSAILKVVNPGL
ncbi:MAG TPA: cation-translocating P-type ATPase, partial [Balneolaceae bacterium]|nr:cation-translocating P-type ATPase [Balneolaceae bacterium]